MKPVYFFRPIWRLLDFKGVTGRAEYFTYTVASFLVTVPVWLFCFFGSRFNWHNMLPPEMLNDETMSPFSPDALFFMVWVYPVVSQLPLFALTVRRLRDQYASWSAITWFFVPILGAFALFLHGFVPTFRDYEVRGPDGNMILRSRQISDRRFRNLMIGASALAAGAAVLADGSGNDDGMRLVGGKRVGVNGNASAFKPDGTINNRTSILGRTRAHTRVGKPVKGYGRKYTL